MIINSNLSANRSARLLASSNQLLAKSLARLSSGSKITSPEDDAAGLAQSSKLNSQVRRIDASLQNTANLISFLQTKDGYLQKVSKALDRLNELAVLSKDVTKTDSDVDLYKTEMSELNAFIAKTANSTFNGIALFSSTDRSATTDGEGGTVTLAAIDLIKAAGGGDGDFTIKFNFADEGVSELQKNVLQSAASRWQSIMTADYGGSGVDDVTISVNTTVLAADGLNNTLASAGRTATWGATNISAAGTLNIDPTDLAANTDDFFYAVYLHEIGHVLGFSDSIFQAAGLSNGDVYTGANALAKYKELVNSSATSIELEDDGGAGTASSHWEESETGAFDNELMTGFSESSGTAQPLSEITIGAFKDLGYSVEYDNADPFYGPGSGSGPRYGFADIASAKRAIEQVAKIRASVGGQLTRALATQDQLMVQKENLSQATSRIADTDVAEESAQFSKAQILVSSGTAMLAQANVMPQLALRLLAA
jgi:flagellin